MVKKEATATKPRKKYQKRGMTAKEREELLIQNFVGLQHAMTNLSIKFEALTDTMVTLLNVFEQAARNFDGASPNT